MVGEIRHSVFVRLMINKREKELKEGDNKRGKERKKAKEKNRKKRKREKKKKGREWP